MPVGVLRRWTAGYHFVLDKTSGFVENQPAPLNAWWLALTLQYVFYMTNSKRSPLFKLMNGSSLE